MKMKNQGKRIGKIIVWAAAILIFAALARAELYEPHKKSVLPPPTPEEFERMKADRPVMLQKLIESKNQLAGYKMGALQSYTEPTPNMFDWDVLYYEINIDLDFSSEFLIGHTTTTLASLVDGLDRIDLNAASFFDISSVMYNDTLSLSWNWVDWFYLTCYLPEVLDSGEQCRITVFYSCYPNDGGAMMFYYDLGSHVCFTSCEPFWSRFWWPCKDWPFDKPDSVDIVATHPDNHTFVSNGLMRSRVDNGNGTATTNWHTRYPVATYLVFVGCTDYGRLDQSWEYAPGQFMPIEQYYYPGAPPDYDWSSAYFFKNFTIPSLEAHSYWFTLYPFIEEKYGHNHFGWGGAMEHQTCTSISAYFNTDWVIAHELAHQWGGDLVTCRDFHHMWLNEGFASYAECLAAKYHYGDEIWKEWLMTQKHLDAGTPYVENLELDNVFDGVTVYDKGSWIFYMLHMILGDEGFRTAMDNYFHDPELAFASAYTCDLERVCASVYGAPMDWFFDTWVYYPGNPEYYYSYMYEENLKGDGYKVNLFIDQRQTYTAFTMPVEMIAYAGGYDTTFTVFNDMRSQLVQFDLPNPPDSILLDPYEKILRRVTFEPGFSVHIVGQHLPDAYLGTPYSVEIESVGGTPPFTWSKASGQLPYGTTLQNIGSGNALIAGTPTFASDYSFTLRLEDSSDPTQVSQCSFAITVLPPPPICGDVNGDQAVNVADIVYLINYVYLQGPVPDPLETGDVNCDGKISLTDIIYLVNYIFRGGAEPCAGCPL
jgi:aminopeptidase N